MTSSYYNERSSQEDKPHINPFRDNEPIIKTVYIPSFRTVVEAWECNYHMKFSTLDDLSIRKKTKYVRNYLLPFVPDISYSSIKIIEHYIVHNYINFNDQINQIISTVNSFLENKQISITHGTNETEPYIIRLLFKNGVPTKGLVALSSGEKEVTTLIFALYCAEPESIILIDEPEISLNVDWQRRLLKKIRDKIQTQLILCTHSPIIGADFGMEELPYTTSSVMSES